MPLKDVRIVELPAMRVASALGYGENPEDQAWEKINALATKIGLKAGEPGYRTFGFDNPSPSPGSPNYGYEMWLVIDSEVTAEPPIEIKDIPATTYAVTRFTGLSKIGGVWRDLVAWFEESPYKYPPNCPPGLEEVLNPAETDPEKWTFDLYFPVQE